MTENRLFRRLAAVPRRPCSPSWESWPFRACGGGSGAPNNPYAPGPATPGPLTVLPTAATAYSGIPTTLTVSGGTAPVPGVLEQHGGAAGHASGRGRHGAPAREQCRRRYDCDRHGPGFRGQRGSRDGHRAGGAAPRESDHDHAERRLCGRRQHAVLGRHRHGHGRGGSRGGRRHRGSAGPLRSHLRRVPLQTSNPALPLASTITVVTDSSGTAVAGIAVNVNAPTQIAIDPRDRCHVGQSAHRSVPDPAGDRRQPDPVRHSDRHRDHRRPIDDRHARRASPWSIYIYGGTPPYKVDATFPGVVTLAGVPVTTQRGQLHGDDQWRLLPATCNTRSATPPGARSQAARRRC